MSKAKLRDFEKELFGGHSPGHLHGYVGDDGYCARVFLMDAEYDPVRITFDGDGDATIHADEYKWHTFTADQLRFIASKAPAGARMVQRYYDKHPEE